jgi:hypothetical protein
MDVKAILEQHGWIVEQQKDWLSVWDHRPEFRKISSKGRVAKIVGSGLYVVPAQLSAVTNTLIIEANAEPKKIKSTSGSSSAEYVGFDTSTVTEEKLKAFVLKLHAAINEML